MTAAFAAWASLRSRSKRNLARCCRNSRSYGHFDALLVSTEVGMLVHKTPETVAAV